MIDIALLILALSPSAVSASDKAAELSQDAIIIDTHIDVPYRIKDAWEDVSKATPSGDFDLPRATEGGLNTAFMSIYIPAQMEIDGGSWQLANELIDSMEALVGRAPGEFTIVRTPDDAVNASKSGIFGIALGIENGAPIEGDLGKLRHFFDRGVRYVTLAHSKSNHIADSSYDEERKWDGLSPFGEEVVREMNRLGMLIDISHVSDAAFNDVINLTNAPVIASHSSARYFTPDFERNMSDDMIKALAENGGVIQVNFGSAFLTAEANAYSKKRWEARDAHFEAEGIEDDSEAAKAYDEQYLKDNPYPYASLDETLDHFDHIIKLVGEDHVGIGSDYDGVGDSLPEGLKDAAAYPNLVQGFMDRGYSESRIRKILGENLLRVWRAVEEAARR